MYSIQLHPFIRITLSLMLGMLAAGCFSTSQPMWWAIASVVCIILTFLVPKRDIIQTLFVFLTTFALGGFRMSLAHFQQEKKERQALMMSSNDESQDEVGGVLLSTPVRHGKVLMCDMLVVEGVSQPLLMKASIWYDEHSDALQVGNGVRFIPHCEPLENFEGSAFDYATYLRHHGFAGRLFLPRDSWYSSVVDLKSLSLFTRTRLTMLGIRSRLVSKLESKWMEKESLAVIVAMTLGDKSLLTQETKDLYSSSGASHVLALSGLHLGIIYGLLLMLSFRRKTFVFTCAVILVLWLYVLLVGMSSSVVRAAVLLSLYTLLQLLGREKVSLNALGFAGFLMLLVNPESLYDVGFQLSFVSVGSILLCSRFIQHTPSCLLLSDKWKDRTDKYGRMLSLYRNGVRWLWQMMGVSLSAGLGVTPLVAYYFGRIPVYFLLTNVIVVPLSTLIIVVALFYYAFCWFGCLEWLLGHILSMLVNAVHSVLSFVSSLPGACIEGVNVTVSEVILAYAILAMIYVWAKRFVKDE